MDKDQWEPVQEPDVGVVCVTKTIKRAYLFKNRCKAGQRLSSNRLPQTAEDRAAAAPAKVARVVHAATDVDSASRFPITQACHTSEG